MAIKKIRVKNFRSFKDMEVELGNLNILIGANASGKSNFVEIFRFLSDIQTFGLDNAISLQGGAEYLRNTNVDSSEVLLKFTSDQEIGFATTFGYGIDAYEAIYEFTIVFNKSEFEIAEDELIQKCKFTKWIKQKNGVKKVEIGQGEIGTSNNAERVSIDLSRAPAEVLKEQDKIIPKSFIPEKLPDRVILLEGTIPFIISKPLQDDISIYDFDPKLPKKYGPIVGKAELEGNGENLAIVLKNIMANSEEKRKFFNLVKYLLPFVDDVSIERALDKSLLLRIRETYSKEFLPASLISDGTINMISLVLALYFGKKLLTIIEEPERNIHPYLISKVVHMMEDASQSKLSKQIIVTTHNPEMLRYAKKEDILLVSRSEEGFSSIFRPSDKEHVKMFLENGLRMEELYVDNFLET
jgi:predicted ATPase